MESANAWLNAVVDVESLNCRALADFYYESLQGTVKDTTLGEYRYQIDKYFLEQHGSTKIELITSQDLRKLLLALVARNLSASTANTVRQKIYAMFTFAERSGFLKLNPCRDVRLLKPDSGKQTLVQAPWSLEESRSAIRASRGTVLQIMVPLALHTGLRRGEIIGLKWGDYSPENKTLSISRSVVSSRSYSNGQMRSGPHEQSPKTAKSARTIYVNGVVEGLLLQARRGFAGVHGRLPEADDYMVINKSGYRFDPSAVGKLFKKFCLQNSLRPIRFHDMRHTAAVLALEAGVPLEAVSEAFGHSGVEITKRTYAPHVPGLSRKFAIELESYLDVTESDPGDAELRAVGSNA
jgi:integrase